MTDISVTKGNCVDTDKPALTDTKPLVFEFPQIPLHLSLDSLLVHSHSSSRSPPSNIMAPSESGLPSLEDSWASLTDVESSNDDDLQSEHTDVGSLLDVHSSDDVRSVIEGVDESDGESDSSGQEEDVADTSTEDLGRGTILTASTQQEEGSHHWGVPIAEATCTVPNVDIVGKNAVRTHSTIRPLSEADQYKLQRHLGNEEVSTKHSSVITMTVLEEGLDLNTLEYFKIVLLGRQIEQFKPEVQRKLGDVLVSRTVTSHSTPTSLSRFHLVPNSFGPGSSPEFADLVAIDKQIDFECYDLIEEDNLLPHRPSFTLRNSQTHSEIASSWNGREYVVAKPRWTLPDLAVICVHLDDNHKMDAESHRMLRFAARHGIPSILIRMDRAWYGDYSNNLWDTKSLCESITPEHATDSPPILQQLPVDIATLLNLDPTLLNQHIAYITSMAEPACVDDAGALEKLPTSNHEDWLSYSKELVPRHAGLIKNTLVTLWIVGVYIFLGSHLWPVVSDVFSDRFSNPIEGVGMMVDLPSPISTNASPTSSHTTLSEAPSGSTRTERQLGLQTLATPSRSAISSLREDTMQFQVSIAGDGQLLVKLPKAALNRKKRSSLSVVVKRDNHTIPAVVWELFEGVFSVQLDSRDAYGDVIVHLSMTKPELSENLTVSLGDQLLHQRLPLKAAFIMIEQYVQDALRTIPTSFQHIRPGSVIDNVSDNMKTFTQSSRRYVEQFWSSHLNLTRSQTLTDFLSRFRHPADSFYLPTDFLEWASEGFRQGQGLLMQLSNGLSMSRLGASEFLGNVHLPKLDSTLDTTRLVAKVATAQERAQQILANAAASVRARKPRR